MGIRFLAPQSASDLTFTPVETLTSTTVQAAILEVLQDGRAYADAIASGLDVKAAVQVATNAALPANTRTGNVLTASANGAMANVDASYVPSVGARVLVKNEALGENNGIYTVTAVGDATHPFVLTRSTDMDGDPETTSGVWTEAVQGAHALKGWVLTTLDPITLNITPLVFSEFNPFNLVVGTFGSTPDAKGATVAGNTITMQPADASHPGMMTSGTQGFGGAKSFSSKISANAGIDVIGGIAALSGGATLSGRLVETPTALYSVSNGLSLNLALGNNFTHTLTEGTQLVAPTNAVAGQEIKIVLTQGATPYTMNYNSFWKFPLGVVPTLTATAYAVDVFVAYIESSTRATCRLLPNVS